MSLSEYFRSVGRFAARRLLPKGIAYPVIRGPLRGFRFILGAAAGDGGGATVYVNLSEPKQTQVFVDIVKPGMVLFDIGANVGYYTLLGSRVVGPDGMVLSIEPVVRNICFLSKHLRLNNIYNVIIIPVACADSTRTGLLGFSMNKNVAEGHLDQKGQIPDASNNYLLVSVVTVDMITKKMGVYPNVIKIDVEGAELEVLHGARETLIHSRATILLSVHSSELRSACLEYLNSMGYLISPINGNMHEASEYYAMCS